MPECTKAERAVLDCIIQDDRSGMTTPFHEHRMRMLIEKVPAELVDATVEATRRWLLAADQKDICWKKIEKYLRGDSSKAFGEFYDHILERAGGLRGIEGTARHAGGNDG